MVKAGQVLALMDTQDLQASLQKAAALVLAGATRSLDEAQANLEAAEDPGAARAAGTGPGALPGAEGLCRRGRCWISANSRWMARSPRRSRGGQGSNEAQLALDAATHDVELYQVNIADNTLVAPRDGRIQYRIANVGEVLPAGGKVFTMLDTSYVYMDIYLPTRTPAGSGSAPTPASSSTPIPNHADPGQGGVHRHPGAVHAQGPWRPRTSATS